MFNIKKMFNKIKAIQFIVLGFAQTVVYIGYSYFNKFTLLSVHLDTMIFNVSF